MQALACQSNILHRKTDVRKFPEIFVESSIKSKIVNAQSAGLTAKLEARKRDDAVNRSKKRCRYLLPECDARTAFFDLFK